MVAVSPLHRPVLHQPAPPLPELVKAATEGGPWRRLRVRDPHGMAALGELGQLLVDKGLRVDGKLTADRGEHTRRTAVAEPIKREPRQGRALLERRGRGVSGPEHPGQPEPVEKHVAETPLR